MAMSYLTENEAPRDFRVSSTESDGHYKKCLLCYTVKRNFYCPECIRAGNFVQSSMPYSDRFAEKQAKLLRLKANRQHVLDRCEKLLSPKIKKDTIITETKLARDKIDLLRLAIEQCKSNIDAKRKELVEITNHNNGLRLKLPRYQKRVSDLGKHVQNQRMELQKKCSMYHDQTQALAALRRSRIRQLTKYIFPVYVTYDSSDSIEDMEFVGDDILEEEPPKRSQLHIVAPWIDTDADFSHIESWMSSTDKADKETSSCNAPSPSLNPVQRSCAAVALAAQLTALLAAALDVRLPHALKLSEYCLWRASAWGLRVRVRRLCACVCAVCVRSGVRAPAQAARHALMALDAICLAAKADAEPLGRVDAWMSNSVAASWESCDDGCAGAPPFDDDDDAEPEHLHWPDDNEMEVGSASPPLPAPLPAPAASLVTSAAASLVSMWRGWTK